MSKQEKSLSHMLRLLQEQVWHEEMEPRFRHDPEEGQDATEISITTRLARSARSRNVSPWSQLFFLQQIPPLMILERRVLDFNHLQQMSCFFVC